MVVKTIRPEDMAAIIASVDWAKVDATSDADIARQIAEDPDTAPELTDAQIDAAKVMYRVRKIREQRGYSQPQFASAYGLPVGTIRDWEQGRTRPDGPALTLLAVIEAMPEQVEAALAKRRMG